MTGQPEIRRNSPLRDQNDARPVTSVRFRGLKKWAKWRWQLVEGLLVKVGSCSSRGARGKGEPKLAQGKAHVDPGFNPSLVLGVFPSSADSPHPETPPPPIHKPGLTKIRPSTSDLQRPPEPRRTHRHPAVGRPSLAPGAGPLGTFTVSWAVCPKKGASAEQGGAPKEGAARRSTFCLFPFF